MPTDDERREVARSLRDSAEERMAVKGIGNGNNWSWLYRSIFGHYMGTEKGAKGRYAEVAHRLADLIDPTCLACPDVEDTPDGGQFDCWSCSVCGNILSSDPDYDTDTDGPTYCEVCGHRIVGKGEPTWL